MRRKKILFVTPSLYGGGAERVLVVLLRNLDRSLFEPSVVMFEPRNDYAQDIPADIKITLLQSRGMKSIPRLAIAFARFIRRESPDIICTSIYRTHYLSLVVAFARRISGMKTRMMMTEHGNLSWCMAEAKLRSIRKMIIRSKYLYPGTDTVVCVSEGLKEDLTHNWSVLPSQVRVIHNPVEIDRIEQLAKEPVEHPWFSSQSPVLIACGRLDPQKNYPLMFRAFKKIREQVEDTRLVVLGEGPLRDELLDYCRELGIEKSIEFLGFQKNPFRYIARSKALLLSSSMEGFPLVLNEAMACSTTVVSTRCQYGPEEIVVDGVNGILVAPDDEQALANAALALLKDDRLCTRLAIVGRQQVERLRDTMVVRSYERLFLSSDVCGS